jgi:choline dehydrogenase-like flavoprotein
VILTGDASARGPLHLRVTLTRPRSRGTVGLDETAIRYGYLADPADLAALRDAVRTGAGLLRAPEMAGVVTQADIPSWVDGRDSDAEADTWIRARLGTALHSCGTARIGAGDDPDAVADAHGRVHGVEALRIADGSLLPDVPSRGTALAAVMIGERLAELVAGE